MDHAFVKGFWPNIFFDFFDKFPATHSFETHGVTPWADPMRMPKSDGAGTPMENLSRPEPMILQQP